MVDARLTLQRLIEERGEDFASLSRLIGRNSAYIQQFIKRGVPRKLDENDRRLLAAYFGIDERLLGAPAMEGPIESPPRTRTESSTALLRIPPLAEDDRFSTPPVTIALPPAYLATLACEARRLVSIRIRGDSMAPTLRDGDLAMVDLNDGGARLREGLYLLDAAGGPHVKRIAVHPGTCFSRVYSDNPAYPAWPECRTASLPLIGRLVWFGRGLN